MERKHALIFAVIITILIAANFLAFKSQFSLAREQVVVSRVIDGDTFQLEDGRIIRLSNINTPEKNTINYELAISYLNQFLNKSIELEIMGTERYGRVLGRVYSPDYINLELVRQGFASKFLVEESELRDFAKAEAEAIKNGKGIWEKSEFSDCFESDIDKENEKVTIINKCALDTSGFLLKDESTKYYKFKELQIKEVMLHTVAGKDNATDIFWGAKTNVWNNDRDTLYIFDKEGKLAHYEIYGY